MTPIPGFVAQSKALATHCAAVVPAPIAATGGNPSTRLLEFFAANIPLGETRP